MYITKFITTDDIMGTLSFDYTREGLRDLMLYLKENNKPKTEPVVNSKEFEYEKANKCWKKFFDKIKSYSSDNYLEWDDYQFLGYIQDKLNLVVKTNNNNPSRHPTLTRVRKLIALLNGHKNYPTHFDRQRVMSFLNWSFSNGHISELNDLFSLVTDYNIKHPLAVTYQTW